MGETPSGISTRIDRARLTQDLNALEEIIASSGHSLDGSARVRAFQFLDTIAQALKRHNMFADVRLELSIAIRAIPPRVDDGEPGVHSKSVAKIYRSQALESISFLRSMLDDRFAARAG